MAAHRNVVVRLLFQLRGPAGDFFGLPSAKRSAPSLQCAVGNHWWRVHMDVRALWTVCWLLVRPPAAQDSDSWSADLLVAHHSGHLDLPRLFANHCRPRV